MQKNKQKNKKIDNKPKKNIAINIMFSIFKIISFFLIFIIKIPIFLFQTSKKIYNQIQEKKVKIQISNKRKSILPIYIPFQIIKTDHGDYLKFENELFTSDSKIGIILGSRGSGKSAFGIKFLENLYSKTKKNCYAIGFNEEDMPSWINVVQDISQIKNNSFVLIDEGGVLFSSRDSMSRANKMLSDLILISRHKNLSILFISQNSANLDIDIIRQADYLIFKKSSLLQLDFERKKIQDIYKIINPGFEEFDDKYIAYIYSDTFRGFVKAELPSFWSQRISKSFANK